MPTSSAVATPPIRSRDSWQQNYLSTGSTTETGKSTERSDKDSYGANIRHGVEA